MRAVIIIPRGTSEQNDVSKICSFAPFSLSLLLHTPVSLHRTGHERLVGLLSLTNFFGERLFGFSPVAVAFFEEIPRRSLVAHQRRTMLFEGRLKCERGLARTPCPSRRWFKGGPNIRNITPCFAMSVHTGSAFGRSPMDTFSKLNGFNGFKKRTEQISQHADKELCYFVSEMVSENDVRELPCSEG